ncbi:Uncharacterised protein [uncultured archaeon]|nr:Uncharacterised protein [uncultured archaeon]
METGKEEVQLVNRGVACEMQKIKTGNLKTKPLTQIKKEYFNG